ncbi:MAG TPA: multiheme c-type cytochrome [Anaeromyxobacteraceae bacterium]|nr:multiheme c-type cytochrome [Anaeromyxobacteraceae bacterium]
MKRALTVIAAVAALWSAPAQAQAPAKQPPPQKGAAADCVGCHSKETPTVVSDWKLSKHAGASVSCDTCHGTGHTNANDVDKVALPTPDTCAQCHDQQVAQYKKGKHALAWVSMNAMPTIHYQPMALIEGLRGCGGCHKIGVKTEADMAAIKKAGGRASGFGVASCDACHTRHLFSVEEARQPQACQTCHMGFDHPQWEMYSTSKHGVRSSLKQLGVLAKDAGAPTCQTCHMQGGNHEVRTAWGFLAVRLPMPEDKEWAADRVTILQALGVLDPQGKPTPRLEAVKAADMARLTQEAFDVERKKMLDTCSNCHSTNFAQAELQKGDDLIREADRLMATAIREVASLYKDGLLKPGKGQLGAFPDLLTFDDAPTAMEKELFVMFLEHRMRAFQGSFHANPDYALWYGYNEMKRSLSKIQEEAQQIRAHGPAKTAPAKAAPPAKAKPPATKKG